MVEFWFCVSLQHNILVFVLIGQDGKYIAVTCVYMSLCVCVCLCVWYMAKASLYFIFTYIFVTVGHSFTFLFNTINNSSFKKLPFMYFAISYLLFLHEFRRYHWFHSATPDLKLPVSITIWTASKFSPQLWSLCSQMTELNHKGGGWCRIICYFWSLSWQFYDEI